MYIMFDAEISIGSYKIKVKMLLAFFVFIWIIFGHTLSSCYLMEGFEEKEKKEGFTGSGILNIFNEIKFSPECCPNAYTSSSGCACMNKNMYKYLQNRGGNNVPFSQY
jgi:hypothetical protein